MQITAHIHAVNIKPIGNLCFLLNVICCRTILKYIDRLKP